MLLYLGLSLWPGWESFSIHNWLMPVTDKIVLQSARVENDRINQKSGAAEGS